MDVDILNQARSAYFLGNYGKVLEIWQQTDTSDEYFDFIVARALMAQRELKPNSQIQITKKPDQQLLEVVELVSKFMTPLIKQGRVNTYVEDDRKLIEEVMKKIQESFNKQTKYYKLYLLVCAYLSINACEVNFVLQLESNQKDAYAAEVNFLQLLCYLRGKRPELAEKKLTELKKFDDEDILVYLGQIYSHLYNEQHEQTLRAVTETKERFGESAKLMNLMVSGLINLKRYEEAFDLASKLQQALLEKEQFQDRVEIETCLSNLIVLAEICGKTAERDECTSALQTVNPGSLLLKVHAQRLSELEQAFR